MKEIMRFFEQDQFASYIGIELVEAKEGYAKARMVIKPHHLNGVGIVHGGALFTLADLAFAVAANSHGTVSVAINVNISYLKAAKDGILVAEAREVSREPKLATHMVEIKNESGQIVAVFQGLAYGKATPISDMIHNK
jgi:acyl-CoA thioesterase